MDSETPSSQPDEKFQAVCTPPETFAELWPMILHWLSTAIPEGSGSYIAYAAAFIFLIWLLSKLQFKSSKSKKKRKA